MSKLEYVDFSCPVCGYIRHYVATKGEYHLIGHELCDKEIEKKQIDKLTIPEQLNKLILANDVRH